jgi:hypothetical protein
MPPEEQDKSTEPTLPTTSNTLPEPVGQPIPPVTPLKKKSKLPFLVVVLAVLLLGGGAYAYTKLMVEDEPSTPAQNAVTQTPESAETVDELPDGYKLFSNPDLGVSFVYPETWGDVSVAPSDEDERKHNATGTWNVLSFSQNDAVTGGLRSKDWTHNEVGHDGIGQPGAFSLEDSKKSKEFIKPNTIYADTDNEFAYVSICADFCSTEDPRTQLQYTLSISGNDTYDAIEFYFEGDDLPNSEFYDKDNGWDYDKISNADPTQYFKKTDSRYLDLQKLIQSVKNI